MRISRNARVDYRFPLLHKDLETYICARRANTAWLHCNRLASAQDLINSISSRFDLDFCAKSRFLCILAMTYNLVNMPRCRACSSSSSRISMRTIRTSHVRCKSTESDAPKGFRFDKAGNRWVKDARVKSVAEPLIVQPKSGPAYTVRSHNNIVRSRAFMCIIFNFMITEEALPTGNYPAVILYPKWLCPQHDAACTSSIAAW